MFNNQTTYGDSMEAALSMLVTLALGVLVADGPALETAVAVTAADTAGAIGTLEEVSGANTAVGIVDVPGKGIEKLDTPPLPTNDVVADNGAETAGIEGATEAIGGMILDGSGGWMGFTMPVGCDIIGATAPSGWEDNGGIRGGPPIKLGTEGIFVGSIPGGATFIGAWEIKGAPPMFDKRGWTGGGWTGGIFVMSTGALISAEFGNGGIAGGESAFKEAINWGGRTLGTSNPRSFKFINLQAMENSFMSIFPSASVSASALQKTKR